MGDRGNIIVKDGSGTIHLYTHWTGSDLPESIRKSLARAKDRWDDPPYLTRVLFQDMIGKDTGTSGFGISTEMGDGGTDIIVNCDDAVVTWHGQSISFAAYADGEEFKL